MELHEISILNLIPPNLAEDRNIKMIAEAFDEVLREIIKKIPDIAVIPNLVLNQIVSETLIDLLAWQFHVDFYEPDMPLETKRELVLKSLDWHYRKGTPSVVEEIVSTVFSRALVQEWYEYGGLPYRFRIATSEEIPDEATRNKLYRAINSVKNTRSFLDALMQLVYFIDEVIIDEQQEITLHRTENDVFQNGLRYDGRFLCDQGKATYCDGSLKCDGSWECVDFLPAKGTIFDTFMTEIFPNGVYRCDGSFDCSGYITIYEPHHFPTPIFPVDDLEDTLSFGMELEPFEDTARIKALCNGAWICDGSNLAPITDAPMPIRITRLTRCDGTWSPSAIVPDGSWICDGAHTCFEGRYCEGDTIIEEGVVA